MAWELVPAEKVIRRDAPTISFTAHHINFNAYASKIIDFDKLSVRLYVDEEERKVKFEFEEAQPSTEQDLRAIFNTKEKRNIYRMTSNTLKANYKFIKKICESKNPRERVFELVKESASRETWIATLAPSFENGYSRDNYLKIPSEVTGIYRYLSEGEIVYIGKGNVRQRLGQGHRKAWKFDRVEYSAIRNDHDALHWESHWINAFKADNNGDRPIYNRVDGHSQE